MKEVGPKLAGEDETADATGREKLRCRECSSEADAICKENVACLQGDG